MSKEKVYLGCHQDFNGKFEVFDYDFEATACIVTCLKQNFHYAGLRNGYLNLDYNESMS